MWLGISIHAVAFHAALLIPGFPASGGAAWLLLLAAVLTILDLVNRSIDRVQARIAKKRRAGSASSCTGRGGVRPFAIAANWRLYAAQPSAGAPRGGASSQSPRCPMLLFP
jgi:hypothetical protein